ncbi:MAG TPA: MarR family transcriptional regulator [Sphingomonadaceae bacterium]|nr:MarR family transcriptional regulator [Sphingomonadaceae bacterium]
MEAPKTSSDNSEGTGASSDHRLDSAVERLVEEWASVLPSLDRDVRAIAARIARIDDRLRACTAGVLKEAGLADSEFRLLAGLLRSGPPYRRSPSDLAPRFVPVTSGGLTGIANRLEKRGLVARMLHPTDQRSVLIELTTAGKTLALATMEEFAAVEQTLLGGVSQTDRTKINAFLKKMLHAIEAKLGS